MGHRLDGHSTPHHIHGSFAHKTSAQNKRVYTRLFETFGHLHGFVYLHTSFESVPHIHLYEDGQIISGSLHYFFHTHIHESHTVFERTSVFIFAVVGIRREELTDEVAVSRMYLHGVKSGFTRQIYSPAEVFGHFG